MPSDPTNWATLHLASIVNSADDAIISKTLDGIVTSWNRAAERLFGYTEAEAVGRSIGVIVPSDLRQDEARVLDCIRHGDTISHYETVRIHKDGRRIPVSLTVSPIVTAEGEIVGASKIARDISERRRLERDAQHFAAIVASSDDAIVSKDLNGTVVSWNRAAERLFGYSPAEMIGRSIRAIIPPDRQAEEDRVLAAVRRGDVVDHFETVRMRKDGTSFPISLTVSPIRATNGEIIGASKIVRDLTRFHDSQRDALRLAAIVESSDDAIVSKDLDSTVTSWNAAAEAMFGYTAEEMIGRSIRVLLPPDRQQEEDEVLARVRAGTRVEHYETVRCRKDGTRVPVSLTVSPIRGPDGTIVGASKIARDISDRELAELHRQRAEHERQRLLTIAREASELKDEFLATLSHELRTPLNAIVGNVRMIQAGLFTGDKQTRAMDAVARNVASLAQIVEDVLDVSRIMSGKLRLDVGAVDVAAVIEASLETVRVAADAKGIRLDTDVEPRTPRVWGDPDRLQQVLWNLLSNAVKFTDPGGAVRIRLEQIDSHVVLTVADTGVGISEDFLPHVFERFRQADASMSRTRGGLGLGLAIVRQLVEMQGGHISAASAGPGQGATFRIELPVLGSHPSTGVRERTPAQSRQLDHHIAVPRLDGISILAVDDDRDALALVREILEATGAQVVTADSGQQALNTLRRLTPDILLTDLAMPHMSGFELIARVRGLEDRPDIRNMPAAALTAYARSEDRSRVLSSGFQLHLAKPVDPAELMAAMASLVRRQ